MYNFHAVLNGEDVVNMVDDGWTHHEARVWNPRMEPGMTMQEFILKAEEEDIEIMEEHRRRIDETVTDPRTAEILKPYYRYLCKRPCFHDEYLPAFNLPSVTLVDCPAGIETVTERGLRCNGQEYELDCLIYATGFEAEMTPFPRRAGHEIVGPNDGDVPLTAAELEAGAADYDGIVCLLTDRVDAAVLGAPAAAAQLEKWAAGPSTYLGLMTAGFPNFFMVPAPGQQGVISVNFTVVNCEGAEHIAATIKLLDERGIQIVDVSEEAETEYVDGIIAKYKDASVVMEACTPSRLNNEGNPKAMNPRAGSWGGGRGNLLGWIKMLKEWREAGDFAGLETDQPVAAS